MVFFFFTSASSRRPGSPRGSLAALKLQFYRRSLIVTYAEQETRVYTFAPGRFVRSKENFYLVVRSYTIFFCQPFAVAKS